VIEEGFCVLNDADLIEWVIVLAVQYALFCASIASLQPGFSGRRATRPDNGTYLYRRFQSCSVSP
jgi:hypothetical protein